MRGRQQVDWSWHFFERTPGGGSKCSECAHTFVTANASNHKFHLKSHHNITAESAEVQCFSSGQKKLEFEPARFTKQDLEVLACSETFRPFNWTEKKFFRLAFSPEIRCAATLKKATEALAEARLREEAVAAFSGSSVPRI